MRDLPVAPLVTGHSDPQRPDPLLERLAECIPTSVRIDIVAAFLKGAGLLGGTARRPRF